VSKVVNTQLINIDVVNDVSLVGDLSDNFALVDYAALIVTDKPEGHASEYRLGEEITLSLDFTKLDHAFDYRLNRCYATNTDDSSLFYILGDETNELKHGCASENWVETIDQAGYSVPNGFIRPRSLTFPVFTIGDQSKLVIDCEVFLCEEGSSLCDVDYANCLSMESLNSRRKRRAEGQGERVSNLTTTIAIQHSGALACKLATLLLILFL